MTACFQSIVAKPELPNRLLKKSPMFMSLLSGKLVNGSALLYL